MSDATLYMWIGFFLGLAAAELYLQREYIIDAVREELTIESLKLWATMLAIVALPLMLFAIIALGIFLTIYA